MPWFHISNSGCWALSVGAPVSACVQAKGLKVDQIYQYYRETGFTDCRPSLAHTQTCRNRARAQRRSPSRQSPLTRGRPSFTRPRRRHDPGVTRHEPLDSNERAPIESATPETSAAPKDHHAFLISRSSLPAVMALTIGSDPATARSALTATCEPPSRPICGLEA